ncbi:MAG: DUF3800 domain-containing protein [Acidobacteriota bacterium]
MAAFPKSSTLHVHLDESGTLKFTSSGSRYYIFTVVWTYNPRPLALNLQVLRFRLLKQGLPSFRQHLSLERFHATDDNIVTREGVITAMLAHRDWKFAAVVIQKNKVPTKEYEHLGSFYSRFATMPLRFLLRGPIRERAHTIVLYTDRLPSECHRELTTKAIKEACRSELPGGLPFHVYHHASASNSWLQVADYCAWAVARKWEQNDSTTYLRLRDRLAREEEDVLRAETIEYY